MQICSKEFELIICTMATWLVRWQNMTCQLPQGDKNTSVSLNVTAKSTLARTTVSNQTSSALSSSPLLASTVEVSLILNIAPKPYRKQCSSVLVRRRLPISIKLTRSFWRAADSSGRLQDVRYRVREVFDRAVYWCVEWNHTLAWMLTAQRRTVPTQSPARL